MGADTSITQCTFKTYLPKANLNGFYRIDFAVVKTQNGFIKHILERGPQAVSSRSLWKKSISIELLRNKALRI